MTTFIFLMIVVMIVCALLVMVVLSQNPKGGGLSSTFGGGGSQMFGVQRTNDFLDKATWTLAIIIAVLVVVSNFVIPKTSSQTAPEDIINQEQAAPVEPVTTDNSTVKPVTQDVQSQNVPEKPLPTKK